MDVTRRRAVITGLGAITPVGIGVQATWAALLAGRSGVGQITLFDHSRFEVHIAGEVKDWTPENYMDRREARRMDRFTQFAIGAAHEAVTSAKLDFAQEDTTRIGVVLGTGIGGIMETEEQKERLLTRGPDRVNPMLIPKMMGNAAAGMISIVHKLRGPNFCVVTACAAGAHSLGQALRLVQYGEADVVLAGGSEAAVSGLGMAGFANMGALSKRACPPQEASRPFDKLRDGFVLGEGAGVLVVEELERAKRRNAPILAEFAGYGLSGDGHHITAPAEDGGIRAMTGALRDAGRKPEDVDYINTHGTSTPLNDRVETLGIRTLLGPHAYQIPVNSTKSMTGHLLGAAGGVEATVVVMSILNQKVHPTINRTHPDPECDLDVVPEGARSVPIRLALSNSLGFGGHNATLAFAKYEG